MSKGAGRGPKRRPVTNRKLALENRRQGHECNRNAKYSLADAFYRAAYTANPNLHVAGDIIQNLCAWGEYRAAIDFAKAEFEYNQGKPWFLDRYIYILMKNNQHKAAVPLFELLKGDKTYGQGPEYEFDYGLCLFELGTPEGYRQAEIHFKASGEQAEWEETYDYLIECFTKIGVFEENELFMESSLLPERTDEGLPDWKRRYWLAKFYQVWAAHCDETQRVERLDLAHQYIDQAREKLPADDAEGKEKVDELMIEISADLFSDQDGLTFPVKWMPDLAGDEEGDIGCTI